MSEGVKQYAIMIKRSRQIVAVCRLATQAKRLASKWPKDRVVIWIYDTYDNTWDFRGELV